MQKGLEKVDFYEYLKRIGEGYEGLKDWENQMIAQINAKMPNFQGASVIVLNANPFTVGHRYLVEIAAKRSKSVIVFVIQGKTESGGKGNHENTGIEIPFQDRFALTQKALSDLSNVVVLPSGPYLISRDDFPSDFLTDKLGNASAHAILDAMVFCDVCEALGSKTAFAGDEPRDELSEIHLNALRQACAEAKIVLKVAERKRLGDKYISGSLVRQDLSNKNMDEVHLLVPDMVFDYLAGHFA
ncbi:MAG: hypothetical protein MJ057_08455 [Sphaerochaetaceae bacterium]|nr:hypothetical protein [Sphaerochaetaceae bacterium]